jgi:hypothetical protein
MIIDIHEFQKNISKYLNGLPSQDVYVMQEGKVIAHISAPAEESEPKYHRLALLEN